MEWLADGSILDFKILIYIVEDGILTIDTIYLLYINIY